MRGMASTTSGDVVVELFGESNEAHIGAVAGLELAVFSTRNVSQRALKLDAESVVVEPVVVWVVGGGSV